MSIDEKMLSKTATGEEDAPAFFGAARSILRRIRARLRASPWYPLAGRAGLVVVALVVLAWIGRAATAATSGPAEGEAGPLAAIATTGGAAAGLGVATGLGAAAATNAAPALGATTAASAVAPSPPAPIQAGPPLPTPCAPAAGSPSSRATPEHPVYLNYASAEELRRLPGAGPKRASEIVALRQRMGRFRRVEDLLRVKGVGRSTLRKWRPLLRLDAPPQTGADAQVTADAGAPE